MHFGDQLCVNDCFTLYTDCRYSDVREIKIMRMHAYDERFTDVAPKVYHTICNPAKVNISLSQFLVLTCLLLIWFGNTNRMNN